VKNSLSRKRATGFLSYAEGEKTPLAKLHANCPPRKEILNEQRIARISKEKEKG
jgi:hypothetical protein